MVVVAEGRGRRFWSCIRTKREYPKKNKKHPLKTQLSLNSINEYKTLRSAKDKSDFLSASHRVRSHTNH
jgi:hypothetical protein